MGNRPGGPPSLADINYALEFVRDLPPHVEDRASRALKEVEEILRVMLPASEGAVGHEAAFAVKILELLGVAS